MKRLVDTLLAGLGLAVLSPLLAMITIGIALSDGSPILYRQMRVGRGFVPFTMYKFRTMASGVEGPQLTAGNDSRVTRAGRTLRKWKLDELPQLFNVVRGDMSLVGPRPEVSKYVERYRDDFAVILSVRPGITGAGSVHFRNESETLGATDDPERTYVERVLPQKIAIEIDYVAHRSIIGDLKILAATAAGLFS